MRRQIWYITVCILAIIWIHIYRYAGHAFAYLDDGFGNFESVNYCVAFQIVHPNHRPLNLSGVIYGIQNTENFDLAFKGKFIMNERKIRPNLLGYSSMPVEI